VVSSDDLSIHLQTPFGRLCNPLVCATELAEELRLKTLDLLYLAYVKAMRERGPVDTHSTKS
jgi:hypothetical protein